MQKLFNSRFVFRADAHCHGHQPPLYHEQIRTACSPTNATDRFVGNEPEILQQAVVAEIQAARFPPQTQARQRSQDAALNEVLRPAKEILLPVPIGFWTQQMNRLNEIADDSPFYDSLGWALIGGGISALLATIALPLSTKFSLVENGQETRK